MASLPALMDLNSELDLDAFLVFSLLHLLIVLLFGYVSCSLARQEYATSKRHSIYQSGQHRPCSKNAPSHYRFAIVEYDAGSSSERQVVKETYYTFLGVENCLTYAKGTCTNLTNLSFTNVIMVVSGFIGFVGVCFSSLLQTILGMHAGKIESYGWALIFSALLFVGAKLVLDLLYIQPGLKEYTVK